MKLLTLFVLSIPAFGALDHVILDTYGPKTLYRGHSIYFEIMGRWVDSFTATVDPVTNIVTAPGHNFVNNDYITFYSTGTLPSPLRAAYLTHYIVRQVNGNNFRVYATGDGKYIYFQNAGTGTLKVGKVSSTTATHEYVQSVTGMPSGVSYSLELSNTGGSLYGGGVPPGAFVWYSAQAFRVKLTATAGAALGAATISVTVRVSGYSDRVIDWPITVSDPTSVVFADPGSYPVIPQKSMWENSMTNLARKFCNPSDPFANQFNFNDETQGWYYDGAWIYYQVADYTGDTSWRNCGLNISRQYQMYSRGLNYSVNGANDVLTGGIYVGGYMTNGQVLTVLAPDYGSLPTGVTIGQVFYARDVSNYQFKVSSTSGGPVYDFLSDGYVRFGSNGSVQGWRAFVDGLEKSSQLYSGAPTVVNGGTGSDDTYVNTIKLMGENGLYRSGQVADYYIREISYRVETCARYHKLFGVAAPMEDKALDTLIGMMDQLFIQADAGFVPFIHQLFFDGLALRALIRYYDVVQDDRIPGVVKYAIDWMWTNAWVDANHTFYYNPYAYGPSCSLCGTSVTGDPSEYPGSNIDCRCRATTYGTWNSTDGLALKHPAWAWFWRKTGIDAYRVKWDTMFQYSAKDVNATVTAVDDIVHLTGHPWINGDAVNFYNPITGSLPSPAYNTELFYVRDAAADTFKVSLTPGGASVNFTTDGNVLLYWSYPIDDKAKTFNQNFRWAFDAVKWRTSPDIPTITTLSLASGTVNVAYSDSVAAVNGTPPYTWTISAGSLPHNLSINAGTGAITGTPDTAGISNFTVKCTDSVPVFVTKDFSITIEAAPTAPTITSTSPLPAGTVGADYSRVLAASGTVPLAWSIIAGALPNGLILDSSGIISGIPSISGIFDVTIRASNSAGNDSKVFSVTIGGAPTPRFFGSVKTSGKTVIQ